MIHENEKTEGIKICTKTKTGFVQPTSLAQAKIYSKFRLKLLERYDFLKKLLLF